jgi:threonylcarbamoyladenosine tRNA methylthiotransferase MtaB
VILLADDCGSYGSDIGTDIVTLLESVLSLRESFVVQLSSFYPGKLLTLYDDLKAIVHRRRLKYISIPVQSGSDRILRLMNREYSLVAVRQVVEDIKRISPSTNLNTHALFNFPTESREDFLATLQYTSIFDETHFFSYCDTPGTESVRIAPKLGSSEREFRIMVVTDLLRRSGRQGMLMEGTVRTSHENSSVFAQ